MTTCTQADIFGRVFEMEDGELAPEAARSILKLDFNADDRDRMNVLAEKARQGALSHDEDEELSNYIQVGHLLAIMQSKARQSLRSGEGDR